MTTTLMKKKVGRPSVVPNALLPDMLDMWKKGLTYSEIGETYKITRQMARYSILKMRPSVKDQSKHYQNRQKVVQSKFFDKK